MSGIQFVNTTVAEFFALQPDRYSQGDLVDEILAHIEGTMPEAWVDLIELTKRNHIEMLLRNRIHATRRRNRLIELNNLAKARGGRTSSRPAASVMPATARRVQSSPRCAS